MPELPEVETTVLDLRKKVLGRIFVDVWADFLKMVRLCQGYRGQVKKPFDKFKKEIKGKKIKSIRRRGKNILFELSGEKTLLIHQKLTGHILYGTWDMRQGIWNSREKGPLDEPVNKFIHLVFWLNNGKMLVLSDLRKFAKVELWDTKKLNESDELKSLGPEPLEKIFTFRRFQEALKNKRGKIKQVLMDQTVIAGIGNIYSDEILWAAGIHPFEDVAKLGGDELKKIYGAMRKILSKAIELGGESISDFRRIFGQRGYFDRERKVYRREGEPCFRCHAKIKRVKLGGRSAHYCPICQK